MNSKLGGASSSATLVFFRLSSPVIIVNPFLTNAAIAVSIGLNTVIFGIKDVFRGLVCLLFMEISIFSFTSAPNN